jgi:hypothetical protein
MLACSGVDVFETYEVTVAASPYDRRKETKGQWSIRSSMGLDLYAMGDRLPCLRILIGHVLLLDHRKTGSASWPRFERRLPISLAVAAHLLPGREIWDGAGLAEGVCQAGDQGRCGVEVRGFEPLASSVRGRRSAGLSYTPG